MKSVTFFSYKGGVGRTLAAANFALYSARAGLATAIVDFDLDAPGVDSKFSDLAIAEDKPGVLDYILDYQETGKIASIKEMATRVPLPERAAPLWVLHAGQYLQSSYFAKLHRLDWARLFSENGEGVAFFQQFLSGLEQELQIDLAVFDSRAGVSEIAGLCTQQLGDEVVLLTSLAAESIKVTRHIVSTLEQSKVARALDKAKSIKVVVTRIPRPDDLPATHARLATRLKIDPGALFFLFSSRELETEEFLAFQHPTRDEKLTEAYVMLFGAWNAASTNVV